MNARPQKRRLRAVSTSVLVAAFFGAGGAPAQQPTAQDRPLDRERVRALVEQALPSWDERVLAAKEGADWSSKTSVDRVLGAVADKPLAKPAEPGARRVVDGERVVRLYGERGKLRYVSRERAWNVKQASEKNVDGKRAGDAVAKALATLGLPRDEFGKSSVAAQIAQGAATKPPGTMQRFEMYQVVTVGRRVNGLPVYGSRARGAVAHSGAIQRLQVSWPAFRMPPNMALRAKEEVVSQVVSEIVAQQARADTRVAAYLAYAPAEVARPYRAKQRPAQEEKATAGTTQRDDETTYRHAHPPRFGSSAVRKEPVRFVPVVVVSVLSLPTPYQVVVPIARGR